MGMEWIESIHAVLVLKDKKMLERLICFQKLLEAVIFLHEQSVLHRDLKQENIHIDAKDKIVLLDFGLARNPLERGVTLSETALGTLPYASPNMLRNAGSATEQDDVFALGLVFWEFMNAKECPTAEYNIRDTEGRSRYRLELARTMPKDLLPIFFKATYLDELKRYQTVNEMYEEVSSLIKKFAYGNLREDSLDTIIVPGQPFVASQFVPLRPPVQKEKRRGWTARFTPAEFQEGSEIEEIEEQKILHEKLALLDLPSSCEHCKFQTCKEGNHKICNYFLKGFSSLFEEIFLKG
jgi:serine/threonine protein kinase